jgi:hypothetical protein
MTTRVKAFFRHLSRVRTPHHSDLVARLQKLPKYRAPRPSVEVIKRPIALVKPRLSDDEWYARYAPDHRKVS